MVDLGFFWKSRVDKKSFKIQKLTQSPDVNSEGGDLVSQFLE